MKLPKFLFDAVSKHKTSLGDNAALPPEEDYPFDYKILKNRFNEVTENIKKCNEVKSLDEKYLTNLLSKLINICKEKEKPFKENLIKLCENIVNETLQVPAETVNVNCELVEKIKPKNAFRLMPEKSEKRDFDFDDLNDFENVNKVILKRRLINSLVQGASYKLCELYKIKKSSINNFDESLVGLYNTIIAINDYLLFVKKDKINEDRPMQGSCVEVMLGRNGEKTEINVQGIIFPFLLNELFRGYFELFASHGLPKDYKKANYILRQSDFLLAEPWDLRMGVGLWDIIGENVDPIHLPYYFSNICEMPVDEFNFKIKEILAKTKHGKNIKSELESESSHDYDMCKLTTTIKAKNDDSSILTDSYLSSDDLDNYIIDSDDDDGIIEEDESENETDNFDFLNGEITIDDLDFNDYTKSEISVQMQLIIKGNVIPVKYIDFYVSEFVLSDGQTTYQGDIKISPIFRGHNLAYKIFCKFIQMYEQLYFSRYDRNNKEMITIKRKLGNTDWIGYEVITDKEGFNEGILFYRK